MQEAKVIAKQKGKLAEANTTGQFLRLYWLILVPLTQKSGTAAQTCVEPCTVDHMLCLF